MKNTKKMAISKKKGYMKWLNYKKGILIKPIRESYELIFYVFILIIHLKRFFQNYSFMQSSCE